MIDFEKLANCAIGFGRQSAQVAYMIPSKRLNVEILNQVMFFISSEFFCESSVFLQKKLWQHLFV